MKFFQVLLFSVAIFSLCFAVFLRPALRQGVSSLKRNTRILAALMLTALFGSLLAVLTPTESRVVWHKGVTQQHIILGEQEGYGYLHGVVLVPTLLPLPAISGVLAAVATPGTSVELVPQTDTKWTVRLSNNRPNTPAALVCLTPDVLGIHLTVESDALVRRCK